MEDPILLRSDRLQVEVARPGTAYKGTRFDWTGFITQVILDDKHTFCGSESDVPGQGTGGVGLCGEFGIEGAVGYEEAAPGEEFLKFGVGLLRRPGDGPYEFWRPYAANTFPMDMDVIGQTAVFTVHPLPCRGYAVRLTKTVTVDGNRLHLGCRLENTGQKPIVTDEYCHNFLSIDGCTVGPDYVLRFPYDPVVDDPPAVLAAAGREIRWRSVPDGAFYCRPRGFPATSHRWELLHEPSNVGVRGQEDFAPCRMALWGTSRVVSPEIFARVAVAPGETAAWNRTYEFYARSPLNSEEVSA